MRILIAIVFLSIISFTGYSQKDNEILFQYSGQSISIRKSGENNQIFYSEKNDRLLTYKGEKEIYPDSIYYLVKPKVIIFSDKMFESDSKPQIKIRVDYYYQKSSSKLKEIERWQKSYYPSIQKIIKMQDTREKDGKVLFMTEDNSEWLVEETKDGGISLYYLSHSKYSYLDFALMIPDCKSEIVNGIKLQ